MLSTEHDQMKYAFEVDKLSIEGMSFVPTKKERELLYQQSLVLNIQMQPQVL